MDSFWVIIIVGLIVIGLLNYRIQTLNPETFSNRASKEALFDSPNECPFDYVTFDEYESGRTPKYVVMTKIKEHPERELDTVFRSVDEFQNKWDQTAEIFPNLKKCG